MVFHSKMVFHLAKWDEMGCKMGFETSAPVSLKFRVENPPPPTEQRLEVGGVFGFRRPKWGDSCPKSLTSQNRFVTSQLHFMWSRIQNFRAPTLDRGIKRMRTPPTPSRLFSTFFLRLNQLLDTRVPKVLKLGRRRFPIFQN